jgi:hypothetical protein
MSNIVYGRELWMWRFFLKANYPLSHETACLVFYKHGENNLFIYYIYLFALFFPASDCRRKCSTHCLFKQSSLSKSPPPPPTPVPCLWQP